VCPPHDGNLEFPEVLRFQNLLLAMRGSLLRAVLRPPALSVGLASFYPWSVDNFEVEITQFLYLSNLSVRSGVCCKAIL